MDAHLKAWKPAYLRRVGLPYFMHSADLEKVRIASIAADRRQRTALARGGFGVWAALLLSTGCLSPLGGGTPGPETTTGSTAVASSSSTAGTTSTTTGPLPITTTSTGYEATNGDFLLRPDLDPGDRPFYDECDVFAQNCPAEHKCTWAFSNNAENGFAMRCVPLSPHPLANGAPCTYDPETRDGVDDCAMRAMCFDFTGSAPEGTGTCISLCLGSGDYAYCEAGSVCVGGRVLWLCEPMCDPLVQDCPAGARCDLQGATPLCMIDWAMDHGGVGAACWQQDCEVGLTCMLNAAVGCEDTGCCTPFCDRSDPQATCPLPGQKCLQPYDDDEQPGTEAIGVCRLETP